VCLARCWKTEPTFAPSSYFWAWLFSVEHPTNLRLAFIGRPEDIRVDLHESPPALDRLFLRFQIEDREAADEFFCLSERAANDGRFSARHTDAHSLGTGQSAGRYHHATRCCLIDEFWRWPPSVQD